MKKIRVIGFGVLAWLGALLVGTSANATPPPLEAYGDLPTVGSITISPSGTRLAMIKQEGNSRGLVVFTPAGDIVGVLDTEDVRPRAVYFANDDTVILLASEQTEVRGFRGQFEFSGAFAYSIDEKSVVQLLRGADLFPAQSGLGTIVGFTSDGTEALMPAYGAQRPPRYDLFRAKLSSTRGRRAFKGSPNTIGWFVDAQGNPVIREEYDVQKGRYEIRAYKDGKSSVIHTVEGLSRPTSSVVGLAPDGQHAVYYRGENEPGLAGLYLMSLEDASIGRAVFDQSNRDIVRTIETRNRVVLGAQFSGMLPTYEFLEPEMDRKMSQLLEAFSGMSVTLESWTDDFSKIIVRVEGEGMVGDYFLFDTQAMQASFLTTNRPVIPVEAVAVTEVFRYTARDGLQLEAVLTGAPAPGADPEPLLLLPHGGPAAHDSLGFDWMAQFFASRGYTVLQPNFRGSSGYGLDFMKAGHGEWGAKMQHDLSDAVLALAETGRIDPERVCIVGASYGGYAALMGGATTPELYQCVIAIAPVSDTERLLREAREEGGRNGSALNYWKEQLGVQRINDDSLQGLSPVTLAADFDDPVLLLHGDTDTIVPIRHSTEMEKALKRAGKDVRFVTLKDEDHWLSLPETRIQLLREMDAFLSTHLPVNSAAPVQ